MNQTIDQKINALNPGEAVEISRTDAGFVTAERSGDGRTVRFVRTISEVSRVFRTVSF